MKRRTFSSLLLASLLTQVVVRGQPSGDDEQRKYRLASQELERVLADADKLDDALAAVKVKARAAAVLWRKSPERARAIFAGLWNFTEQQKEKTFDQEEARLALLRNLYPKDPALADELLRELAAGSQGRQVSSFDKISGRDPEAMRLIRLSLQLGSTDAALSGKVLEQSLARSLHPMITPALLQLRQTDPLLANQVAARGLGGLK
jgi:hypothetical protein